MTTSVAAQVALASVDDKGCLLSADPRLESLNRRAGGDVGRPFAVPQLAAIVRLARRLGIRLSRQIIADGGDCDLALWVQVEPDGNCWRVEVSGWQEMEPWQAESSGMSEACVDPGDAEWILETDSTLRITSLAREDGARFGFDADALLGKPLTQLFAFSEDRLGDFPILTALAAQRGFEGQVARLRGSGRDILLSATARRDTMGRFAGFEGWVTSVEEERPSDTAEKNAAPLDEDRSDAFGARLSRALRGPLGRIIANADSIRDGTDAPLPADYSDYATDIANAGRHLLGLVEDLVDLQAVEREDFAIEAEEIDLADVARRAAGLLTLRAQQAQTHIDAPGVGETLPAIGEFRRALQVVVNLIGNAVRYSPPGGTIWIRHSVDGDQACLIVADQGKGIAAADQARIFDKFERIDSGESGGSGLGLYIARRLARAMGGDIGVDSAPGEGARFIFSLPLSGTAS